MDGWEMPKEISITAWYTPEIPINQGPENYWGLPGLILEVTDGKTVILCSKLVLNTKEKKETKYYCYFLGQHNNWSGQTYNGYTVNLSRRLRQHNGEIKGGAWATTAKDKGAWSFIAALTSDSWASVSRAMACEWNCRYPTRKKPRPKIFAGAKGRIDSLVEIFKHIKDEVRLYIHPTFYDQAVSLGLPSHVVLYKKLDEIL
jgi:predicted GIY-YIG superfamily endonuclease